MDGGGCACSAATQERMIPRRVLFMVSAIMYHMKPFLALLLVILAAISAAAQPTRPATLPDDVDWRTANIVSEGVRISAEVLSPKSAAGKKLPAIVMGHGWGGVAAQLRRDAAQFAQSGYLVVAFDYRGWGASDSRLATAGAGGKE